MTLRFGMAQWQHPAWVSWLYSSKGAANRRLQEYATYFDAVEVGSSFYADLSADQLQAWYDQVPEHFRFCFKVPQTVTHRFSALKVSEITEALLRFCDLLAPFSHKLGPTMMQFPEDVSPLYAKQINALCQAWSLATPLSIEVRHQAFFNKAEEESSLLRMLSNQACNRVIMDSRPVFSTDAYCDSLIDAQQKKPKVPCHPIATAQHPVVRFIGHPDLVLNDVYLTQWADKLVQWMEQGLSPFVFVHSSDNVAAPILAQRLEEKVARLAPRYQTSILLPNQPQQSSLL